MSDRGPETTPSPASEPMFSMPEQRGGGTSVVTWALAGLAGLLVLGGVLLATRHGSKPAANGIRPLDPYAEA